MNIVAMSDVCSSLSCMMQNEKLLKKLARLEKIKNALEEQVEDLTRKSYSSYRDVQEIYDALKMGIIIFSGDGQIIQKNKFSSDHIVGERENILELVQEKKYQEVITRFIREKRESLKDLELRLFNFIEEAPISYLVSLTTLAGHSGKRFLFVASEITALKKEELKRAELQRQLMQRSFKEGMAETAVSILHNIGNVLTGVVGTIDIHREKKRTTNLKEKMSRLQTHLLALNQKGQLESFFSVETKRAGLISAIEELSLDLDLVEKADHKVMSTLKDKVYHMSDIIAVQQQYAQMKESIKTTVTIGQVLDDCLFINESRAQRDYIIIERDDEADREFSIEKNGFIQVLSNILINAVESIEERISSEKSYDLGRIKIWTSSEEQFLILHFKDDALGFSSEIKEKLFNFGFSSKNRSSGFGLHNCENFMQHQGGHLEITSAGPGLGAEVIIKLKIS